MWGSVEVVASRVPEDGRPGLGPTDAAAEAMGLDPQERPQGRPDVVPLLPVRAASARLDPGAWRAPRWSRAVAHEPSANGNRGRPVIPHVVGRPVRDAAVRDGDPGRLDRPEPRQPHPPCPGRRMRRRGADARGRGRCGSWPRRRAFVASPSAVSSPPGSSRGRGRPPLGPHRGHEGDASNDPTTPAGPAAGGRFDGPSGRLIRGRVVGHHRSGPTPDVRPGVGPERRRVGFPPGRPSGDGVVRRRAGSVGRNAGGLRTRTHVRSRGQDSDGIAGGNVRCAQAPRSNPEPPRADDPARQTAYQLELVCPAEPPREDLTTFSHTVGRGPSPTRRRAVRSPPGHERH